MKERDERVAHIFAHYAAYDDAHLDSAKIIHSHGILTRRGSQCGCRLDSRSNSDD